MARLALAADKHDLKGSIAVEPEGVIGPNTYVASRRRGTRRQKRRLEIFTTHLLGVLASQHHALIVYRSFKSLYSDVLVDSKYARVYGILQPSLLPRSRYTAPHSRCNVRTEDDPGDSKVLINFYHLSDCMSFKRASLLYPSIHLHLLL